MKKILHSHPTVVIGILVIVFVAILVAFYSWAIGDAAMEINAALAPAPAQTPQGFDLSSASNLDFRGLIGASPQSVPASSSGH